MPTDHNDGIIYGQKKHKQKRQDCPSCTGKQVMALWLPLVTTEASQGYTDFRSHGRQCYEIMWLS